MLLFAALFSSLFVPPPYLHSFPTRRSSDLILCSSSSAGLTRASILKRIYRRGWIAGSSPAIDRKSTRLNSSHVSISYAVFCLKKKPKRSQQQLFPQSDSHLMRRSASISG